ncbi:MAG: bifunctional demethylmenaquinone methyltransferase/2-methoxy-6-polyprenyl-1,4-benzoquinol methylase UbiE [Anaerolineales bacterium]
MAKDTYIPALRFDWLTPLYDPLLRWGMREETFKRDLIRHAQLMPGQQVLDLGCGTATLTILIKQTHPDVEVVGLDGDPKVLELGRAKVQRAGVNITLDEGMAFQLPYPDDSFDRVVSSLVFHHLTHENKQRTLGEVYRVLRPCGQLFVVDFGKPRGALGNWLAPALGRFEEAADNFLGLLPAMFREAGFEGVDERARYLTLFGPLALYYGSKHG